MKIGIVCALRVEAHSLLQTLGVATDSATERYCFPASKKSQCSLIISGMGPERAAQAAKELAEEGADLLVSWGFAGGLDPKLTTGQLLIPSRLVTEAGVNIPLSAQADELVFNSLATKMAVSNESLVPVEDAVKSVEDKETLYRASGAAAVDMESGAIASVANEKEVPFLAVRALFDDASRHLPHFIDSAVDEFGSVKIAPFLNAILRHPKDLFLLPSLQRESKAALQSLQEAAKHLPELAAELEEAL